MAASIGTPPTDKSSSELIADGIISVLGPSVHLLDTRAHGVRKSQEELSGNIDAVCVSLKLISESMPNPRNLDDPIKRLATARRKVNIVSSILHNCQDRLRKLHQHIARETQRKEALLKQQQSLNTTLTSQLEAAAAQNVAVSSPSSSAEQPASRGAPEPVSQGEGGGTLSEVKVRSAESAGSVEAVKDAEGAAGD